MSRKSLAVLVIAIGLVAISAAPVMAGFLSTATAIVTCDGYTLLVTGNSLFDLPASVAYTITLTPTAGSPITVTGQLAVSAFGSAGVFYGTATGRIALPPGDYSLTGSATLFTNGGGFQDNTLPISFWPHRLSCSGAQPVECAAQSAISSSFNSTSIKQGSTIWFNARFSAIGVPSTGATVFFTGSTIQITTSAGTQTLTVPDARITFSPGASCASTSFDTSTQTWLTTVPIAGNDEIFLSGLAYVVPVNLPGSIRNVTWQGDFSSSTPGLTMWWKWGAAVYSGFTDYNSLMVKPTHLNACGYNNDDHAGTPENPTIKSKLMSGGTGGGGFNWTGFGSWGGAQIVAPSCVKFVQGNYATPQTPTASVTVPYTVAQGAGDLNVVVVGWNDATTTVNSVKDTNGNTYTRAVGPTVHPGPPGGGGLTQSIYYARNIAGSAANGNAVTVQFSAPAVYPDIRILEYSGLDKVRPLDLTAAAVGNSGTSSSGSVTTTTVNDLLIAANTVFSSTAGPGTGFTARMITLPDGDIVEDSFVTAIGSYAASVPLNGTGPWVMQMVLFKAAR